MLLVLETVWLDVVLSIKYKQTSNDCCYSFIQKKVWRGIQEKGFLKNGKLNNKNNFQNNKSFHCFRGWLTTGYMTGCHSSLQSSYHCNKETSKMLTGCNKTKVGFQENLFPGSVKADYMWHFFTEHTHFLTLLPNQVPGKEHNMGYLQCIWS